MVDKVLTSAQVLKIATEILTWNLPLTITEERLIKIQQIAGAALTQTHDHLKHADRRNKVTSKPRVTINEIARFNAYKKALLK